MKYGRIEGLDKDISRLVLGSEYLGRTDPELIKHAYTLLEYSVEIGINTVDTARVYGNSEKNIGNWLRETGMREKMVVLTKGAHPAGDVKRLKPEDIRFDVNKSLEELKTDYIDIYVLHRDDPSVPVSDIIDTLNEFTKKGIIKVIGGSNWTVPRLAEANAYAKANGLTPFRCSSPHFSIAEQVENPWGEGCISLAGPANAADREWHAENDVKVFGYSSLCRGMFGTGMTTEKYNENNEVLDGVCRHAYAYPQNFRRLDKANEIAKELGCTLPQVALAYCLAQKMEVYPLMGAGKIEEIETSSKATEITLTQEMVDALMN